jgi:hypothetical protein
MRLEKRMLFCKRALLKIACTEADTLLRVKDEIIASANDSGVDPNFALTYFLDQMSFFEITDLETEPEEDDEEDEEEENEEEEEIEEEEDEGIAELKNKELEFVNFPRNPKKVTLPI